MRALLVAATIATLHTPTLPNDRTEFPVIDAHRARVVWSGPHAGSQPGGAFPLLADDSVAYRATPPGYLKIPRCGLRHPCKPL
jgi:hypothetical protein